MSIDSVSPSEWDKVTHAKLKTDIKPKTNTKPTPVKDMVNSPDHYQTDLGIECIQAIEASLNVEGYRGYLKANTIKYLWRMAYKGKALEDCRKARWYLDRLIMSLESDA